MRPFARMPLRGLLALWYAATVIVVIAVAGSVMVWAHTRIGLRRVDAELEAVARTAAGMVQQEFDDDAELRSGAQEVCNQLLLPDTTVAVLAGTGEVLASQERADERAPAGGGSAAGRLPAAPAEGRRRIVVEGSVADGQRFQIRVTRSLASVEHERRMLWEAVGVAVPFALVLAGLGGWIVSRRALRPLTSMAEEATRITERTPDGRLSVPETRDELAKLGRAFNDLLGRLAAALAAQRRFMAEASHELRTPVSIARTAAQVTLGRQHRDEAEYRDALDVIATQAGRLTRMVDDMFLVARADAGARMLRLSSLDLVELTQECVRACGTLAQARGCAVVEHMDEELALVGDEDLLRQMLGNLLDNALRHTPAGSRVDVRVARRGDACEIAVADNGPGVPAEARERIFERFVRLAASEPGDGAGLGLPIARWIAEEHGGSLTLEPGTPAGSTFVVRLPAPGRRADPTWTQPVG